MRTTFKRLLIFASTGAIIQIGSAVHAAEARIETGTSSGKTGAELKLQTDRNDYSGAQINHSDLSQAKRASQLLGASVKNQQNEKLGDIKDLMVDLPSGRVPFAVISSGGLLGVGDRLIAVPVSSFAQSMGDRTLVLNMDKQRLQSAPSFAKNEWPDMSDSAWNGKVYSFYGQQQPAFSSSSSIASSSSTRIDEPAGAEISGSTGWERSDKFREQQYQTRRGGLSGDAYGETETGLSPDRRPRQGLGAEDLTKNSQEISDPNSRARQDAFIREEAGAERQPSQSTTIHRESTTTTQQSHLSTAQMGKTRRASDLIGMEVKNNQNERVGEVKDLVLDLNSGRVTYAVISAGGFLGMGDRLYAVPPSVLTRSTDEKTLIFNTDKETLRSAPSFESRNWSESNNQRFATEVYRYYGQQPYWQGEIREPSGTEQKPMKKYHQESIQQQPSEGWERGYHNKGSDSPQGSSLQEPSGAEPERNQSSQYQSQPSASVQSSGQWEKGSATRESAQIESNATIKEPAGAATSTSTSSRSTATSADQATSDSDRMLMQRVRSALQSDSNLSSSAQNVQVSAANGRIILRGTVASESEKQSIEERVKEAAIDNQLEVKSSSNP